MINIEDLTIKQVRELTAIFGNQNATQHVDSKLIGKYVIARCTQAGVHAGILDSYAGQECVLLESRRLWYWKAADKKSFLSGVAVAGLHKDSKVGASCQRTVLTEVCEYIECSDIAMKSISGSTDYDSQ